MRGQTCRELTVISLQTALSREKFLEDKLLMFKSILTKHSEDTDCSSLINDLQFALKVNINIDIPRIFHLKAAPVLRMMTL